MTASGPAFLLSSILLFSALPVAHAASGPIESYCATLGKKDHVASDGFALTDAAAIIRQDRANYHAFKVRDPGDEGDRTFRAKESRAKLEAMLKGGKLDADTREAIVGGTPDICVDIFVNRIDVALKASLPFVGTWDCEVATFTFTPTVYNNGTDDIPIQEVQEGSDGSYSLFLSDEAFITLSGFTRNMMGWYSSSSGDSFQCTRVGR